MIRGLKGGKQSWWKYKYLRFYQNYNHIADIYRELGSLSECAYRFDYWQLGKVLNHIFQMLTDLINHCFRVLIISLFPFLIVLLSVFSKTFISLCSHVLDIHFASIILDLLIIINSYNEDYDNISLIVSVCCDSWINIAICLYNYPQDFIYLHVTCNNRNQCNSSFNLYQNTEIKNKFVCNHDYIWFKGSTSFTQKGG